VLEAFLVDPHVSIEVVFEELVERRPLGPAQAVKGS
jgi:hypothetical protein